MVVSKKTHDEEDTMKGNFASVLSMTALMVCLSACEKLAMPDEENQGEPNALLRVQTRVVGAGDEGTVSYPVNVYVFNGEECVALQSISDASQVLNVPLIEGSYVVYAIGGASADDYNLPSKATATPSMAIALKEGRAHGDVMVAKSHVVLVDGETNVLTLNMERRVMLLQSVTLTGIPTAATAVSVSIAPLSESLLGVGYAGVSGSSAVNLTKQEDGHTWTFSGQQYLLPPSGETATVTIRIVKPNGTTTYKYNIEEKLEAGCKLNIQSAYTGSIEVTMTGIITGEAWKEEKTISFTFDENGSTTAGSGGDDTGNETGGDVLTDDVPAVGNTYKGCYVLSVTTTNGISEVLLLSPTESKPLAGGETREAALTKVEAALAEWNVEGVSGWRLMTKDEALTSCKSSAPNLKSGSENRYLIMDSGVLKPVTFGTGTVTVAQSFGATNILRPVTTLKFKSEF